MSDVTHLKAVLCEGVFPTTCLATPLSDDLHEPLQTMLLGAFAGLCKAAGQAHKYSAVFVLKV